MKTRIPIPRDTVAEVLFKSAHICCICHNPEAGVQIAHIDDNPSNNAENNLAALCPNDHDKSSRKSPLSKAYTPEEVKKYKKSWEDSVAEKRKALDDPRSIRLIRFDGPDVNTVYLETAPGVLRGFRDELTFQLMGFNWGNVDVYPEDHKNKFEIQEPLKKISQCQKLRLRFSNGTGANEVYVVWEDGRKHHVPDPETLKEIGGFENIDSVDFMEFNSIPHGIPLVDIFNVRRSQLLKDAMDGKFDKD